MSEQNEWNGNDANALAEWARSNVPMRHKAAKIEQGGVWGERFKRAVDLVGKNPGSVVALLGPRGTGKTQIAVELLRHCCSKMAQSVKYTRAIELFMAVKSTYGKASTDNETNALKQFVLPDVLVIDEIQVRGETEWENNLLTYVIDARYAANKATLLIANLKVEAFKESMGDSVVQRLIETGDIIICDGASFRTKPKKQGD